MNITVISSRENKGATKGGEIKGGRCVQALF